MSGVDRIDVANRVFDISSDFSIRSREQKPGPPQRIDAMTMGIITMEQSAPHGGEVHPDGDELLYVISGKVSVTWDCAADEVLTLGPGEGCIIHKGQWHKVNVLEKTQLMFATPGPNGSHRPV